MRAEVRVELIPPLERRVALAAVGRVVPTLELRGGITALQILAEAAAGHTHLFLLLLEALLGAPAS
jgi:hypothetical protein